MKFNQDMLESYVEFCNLLFLFSFFTCLTFFSCLILLFKLCVCLVIFGSQLHVNLMGLLCLIKFFLSISYHVAYKLQLFVIYFLLFQLIGVLECGDSFGCFSCNFNTEFLLAIISNFIGCLSITYDDLIKKLGFQENIEVQCHFMLSQFASLVCFSWDLVILSSVRAFEFYLQCISALDTIQCGYNRKQRTCL